MIKHRPVLCDCLVKGICLELHTKVLFVIAECCFSALIGHFTKIQPAELAEYSIFKTVLSLFFDIAERSDRFRYHHTTRFLPDFTNERIGIAFSRFLTASGQFDFALVILNQKQPVPDKNDPAHSGSYKFVRIFAVVFRV